MGDSELLRWVDDVGRRLGLFDYDEEAANEMTRRLAPMSEKGTRLAQDSAVSSADREADEVGSSRPPRDEEDAELASIVITVVRGALAMAGGVAIGTPAAPLVALANIVGLSASYFAGVIEAGRLSRQALMSLIFRVALMGANEYVHAHRGGVSASTVRASELRSTLAEDHMRAAFDRWIVEARSVGEDREEVLQRTLRAALDQMAANMTQQIRGTEASWRGLVERSVENEGVPDQLKRAAAEKAYRESIAQRRFESLEAFVERGRAQL